MKAEQSAPVAKESSKVPTGIWELADKWYADRTRIARATQRFVT